MRDLTALQNQCFIELFTEIGMEEHPDQPDSDHAEEVLHDSVLRTLIERRGRLVNHEQPRFL